MEGRLVTWEDLDRISTNIPACMLWTYLRIGAYNSVMPERIRTLENVVPKVLTLADFSNGILQEDAIRLYMKVLSQAGNAYIKELIWLDQRDLNAAGATCVNSDDLKVITGADPARSVGIFRKMETDGELMVRVYERCLVESEDLERLQTVRSDPTDRENLFHTGPRKLLQDGSLGAKSVEVIDGHLDEPGDHSIPIYTEEKLYNRTRVTHTVHMNVAIHAISDLVFREVCDVIEQVEREEPWSDHRHGIAHTRAIAPVLLGRMKALGLQAYIQSIFVDADINIIAEWVEEAHTRECYNWKAMKDLGIRADGGSNRPVEPFNVLDNLCTAITRQNRAGTRAYLPEQALTMEQAVRLFTSDAAWVSWDEAVRGTLKLGRQADLAVLDRDLFKVSHQDFNRVKVSRTMLNGVTVYRAGTLQSAHSLDHRQ